MQDCSVVLFARHRHTHHCLHRSIECSWVGRVLQQDHKGEKDSGRWRAVLHPCSPGGLGGVPRSSLTTVHFVPLRTDPRRVKRWRCRWCLVHSNPSETAAQRYTLFLCTVHTSVRRWHYPRRQHHKLCHCSQHSAVNNNRYVSNQDLLQCKASLYVLETRKQVRTKREH